MLQDHVKLFETLKESDNTNLPALDYLFELGALCLLCTFLLVPENVLEASFTQVASRETDDVKGGLYFLNQLTNRLNIDVENDSLGVKVDRQCSGMERNMPDTQNVVDSESSSNGNVLLRKTTIESNECYMTTVCRILHLPLDLLLNYNFHVIEACQLTSYSFKINFVVYLCLQYFLISLACYF
jgi:activating signal cointegrator complex subunit 2